MSLTKLIGGMLYEWNKDKADLMDLFRKLSQHPSDVIRCYAPYLIGP